MTKGQLFIVKVFIVKVAKLNEPQDSGFRILKKLQLM